MRKRILQRKKINLPPNQDKAQCAKYLLCVFSLMWKDRFAFIPLYKRFRPLQAHFSLLGYKNGRVLGSILSNLLKVVPQQIHFGLFSFFMVLWAIPGPQLLFLEEVPSRCYLSVYYSVNLQPLFHFLFFIFIFTNSLY